MPYENGDWVGFPLFDESVELVLDEDEPIGQEYIASCVKMLQTLPDAAIDRLCLGSEYYCESMRPSFGELGITMPEHFGPREILGHIRPSSLMIYPPQGEGVGFSIGLRCDWEREHGLEWVVLDSTALFVGAFSLENPWNGYDYFKKASWNHLPLE